jgi:AAA+ superfamily predicted ATPase
MHGTMSCSSALVASAGSTHRRGMFHSLLYDSAMAAAKGYAHPQVEPRHVLFATARYFRDRAEVGPLFPIAKRALEPRGTAHQTPEVTAEAAELLDSFSTEAQALAGLLTAIKSDPASVQSAVEGVSPAAAESPLQAESQEGSPSGRPTAAPNETTAVILAELEGLIGLDSVKRQLRRIIAVVQANEERSKAGLTPVSPGLHLVFTGPPGTGKTTVARLVARLYASTGALAGSGFTEASRSDLVAGYVGQTAIKTAELIARTRPGVLFIDEAYSLTPRHDSDVGAEAIAALVKAMEDYRRDFAVIAAGYGDEMSDFVASNPGLRSRFKTYITFPSYTPEELTRIFVEFAKASAIGLRPGVLERAEGVFRRAVAQQSFGNARFARSLFEEAYARMSARAAADGVVQVEELMDLALEDVEWDEGAIQREIRRIGFGKDEHKPG